MEISVLNKDLYYYFFFLSLIEIPKYFLVMFSLDCACCNLCFALRSVMLSLRCSFILPTFFSAFSKSSFLSIPSSFIYAFNFLPKTFVVGIPYWSLRTSPICDGECFFESSVMSFFNSGSFIFTHVSLSTFVILYFVKCGF